MKKIIKTVVKSLVLLLAITSCQNARDITSVDSIISDNAFLGITDLQSSLNTSTLLYNASNVIGFSDRITDGVRIGVQSGGQNLGQIQKIITNATGFVDVLWTGRYRMITEINTFLPFAESFDASTPTEQEQVNSIIAQGLALRALAHLDLMAHFSSGSSVNDFDVFAPDNLSVPITIDVDVNRQPRRATVAEMTEFITSELDRASSLLGNPTDNNFVTQQFITAVRSRLAIYTGNNAGAIAAATSLINQFPLANTTQYFNMFRDDTDQTEVIYNLVANQAAGASVGGQFFFLNSFGSHSEVSQDLINVLPLGDIRSNVVLDVADVVPGSGEDRIGKYLGRPGENGRNNVKIFRVSEQYLIRAEARARTGDLNGAAADIDALVDARFGSDQPTPSYGNLEDAITDIILQRRIELAFEGHRYIDLRRTRDITGNGIELDPSLGMNGESDDCGSRAVPCTIPVNDLRFSLPITIDEIAGNPGITQNPGY